MLGGGSHSSVDEDAHFWDIMLCQPVSANTDDEGTTILWNAGNYAPINMA